jgi:hypothetical protein
MKINWARRSTVDRERLWMATDRWMATASDGDRLGR